MRQTTITLRTKNASVSLFITGYILFSFVLQLTETQASNRNFAFHKKTCQEILQKRLDRSNLSPYKKASLEELLSLYKAAHQNAGTQLDEIYEKLQLDQRHRPYSKQEISNLLWQYDQAGLNGPGCPVGFSSQDAVEYYLIARNLKETLETRENYLNFDYPLQLQRAVYLINEDFRPRALRLGANHMGLDLHEDPKKNERYIYLNVFSDSRSVKTALIRRFGYQYRGLPLRYSLSD